MKTDPDVDSYIARAPKEMQKMLKELRKIIRKAAPAAEERISYGMPFYSYKGRLAYFGYAKTHVGLYIPPPVIEEHKDELVGYKTTKSAIHLTLDRKLPLALITRLVKARMKKNEISAIASSQKNREKK